MSNVDTSINVAIDAKEAERGRAALRRIFSDLEKQAGRFDDKVSGMGDEVASSMKKGKRWLNVFNKELDETGRKSKSLDTANNALKSITSKIFNLKTAIAGGLAGLGVGMIASDMIKLSAAVESYETSLTTVMGSSQKARQAMSWIRDFAKETPYQIEEVIDAFVRLNNYGFDPIENGLLRSLGDAAAAQNRTMEQMVEALADAQMGEFERLKEAFSIKATQTNDKIFLQFAKDGKDYFVELDKAAGNFQEKLQEIIEFKGFGGAMENQLSDFNGVISQMKSIWSEFSIMLMDSGPFDVLKSKLVEVKDWMKENLTAENADEWGLKVVKAMNWVIEGSAQVIQALDAFINRVDALFDKIFRAAGVAEKAGTLIKSGTYDAGAFVGSVVSENDAAERLKEIEGQLQAARLDVYEQINGKVDSFPLKLEVMTGDVLPGKMSSDQSNLIRQLEQTRDNLKSELNKNLDQTDKAFDDFWGDIKRVFSGGNKKTEVSEDVESPISKAVRALKIDTKEMEAANDAAEEQQKRSQKLSSSIPAGNSIVEGKGQEKFEQDKAIEAIDKLIIKLEQEAQAYGKSEQEMFRYRLEHGDLNETLEKSGLTVDEVMQKFNQPILDKLLSDVERSKQSLRDQQAVLGLTKIEAANYKLEASKLGKELLALGEAGKKALAGLKQAQADAIGGSILEEANNYKQNLQDQINMLGMTSREADVYKLKNSDLADELRAMGDAGQQALDGLIAKQQELNRASLKQEFLDEAKTEVEKLQERIEQLNSFEGEIAPEKFEYLQQKYAKMIDEAQVAADEMKQIWRDAGQQMQGAFSDTFFDIMNGEFDNLADRFANILRRMAADLLASQLTSMLKDWGASIGGGNMLTSLFGLPSPSMPGRATGGNVYAGQSYIVGEREPELFVPKSNGRIMNQNQIANAQKSGGSGGTSIQLHISGIQDAQGIERSASQLANQLAKTVNRANQRG